MGVGPFRSGVDESLCRSLALTRLGSLALSLFDSRPPSSSRRYAAADPLRSEVFGSRPTLSLSAVGVRPQAGSRRAALPAKESSMKLYVGNISFNTSNEDLAEAFGQHGTVTSAQVVMDRETGRSRGFAFVEMSDGAEAAIAAMHGATFMGRTLTVNEARPREDRPRGGGGGSRGGYGGGGGGGGGRGGYGGGGGGRY